MGNAYYYSLEKILSFCLLSKKLNVNTYETVILPVCIVGPMVSPLEKGTDVSLFEDKVLEIYMGLRETKLQGKGKSYIMLSYMHCILHLKQLNGDGPPLWSRR